MRFIKTAKNLWNNFFRKYPYKTIYSNDIPSNLSEKVIYIVEENGFKSFALMSCPCGCRERIQLPLFKSSKPMWRLNEHTNGSVSLHPSVWRTKGCTSHFFFKKGDIRWC